ncbi:MAG: signal transduction protein, partial [Planctomycetota bacterium]|nr:signal transduction protein [Planctomycetota bacterium]
YASEIFLMGMFSVMDALLDAPMADIMEKLPLDDKIKGTLLGEKTSFSGVYDLITAYELGQWQELTTHAEALKVDMQTLPPVFGESLKWANQAFASVDQD